MILVHVFMIDIGRKGHVLANDNGRNELVLVRSSMLAKEVR